MSYDHFEQMQSYLPMDLLTWKGFIVANSVVISFVLLRYFALVGLFYSLFWKNRKIGQHFTKLHDRKIKSGQIFFEIKWSTMSSLVFAVSGYLLGVLWQLNCSQIYLKFDTFGWVYLPISFLTLCFIHEVYFYFTHIWMHRPEIYKRVHRVHHHSVKTSPWASFSFHPLEALVHALFLPIVSCVLPLHPMVIIGYLTFMTVTAMSNHLGVELMFPKIFQRYFISGTHHGLHHQKFQYNYGLYFRFLDQFLGTEYEERSL